MYLVRDYFSGAWRWSLPVPHCFSSCCLIMNLVAMPICEMFMSPAWRSLLQTPIRNATTRLLATTQSQHQVQGALFLNVVVRQSSAIFQLLACKDQSLLVWRDTLLVLDLGLHVVDSI